ncbi:MAG: tRNA pseudouridine(55) synthase TruB [Rhodobacteraceae bacterium]|jgi:tRNA pseudouridine55 synthase|nr:tRNA pseudouridine(55) synthase TruB [Paracoccaceae bacterium]
MGRRRGRDIAGWLVIDKPAGVTSTAVVNKLRWALDAAKAGHAGTLDPEATGVLAVAFGDATKTIPYVTDAPKAYRFTVRWGIATTTDDTEGEVVATSALRPAPGAITAALPAFRGDIMQVPPQFSAVRVEGARAYDLAREGERLDLAARPLHVDRLDLVDVSDPDHAVLEMVCGKGGYVRAIARDLGRALGCHGHVTRLRRLWSGPFRAEDGIGLDTVEAEARTDALAARLLPLEAGLAALPEVRATDEGAARIRNGNPGAVIARDLPWGSPAWASHRGHALAIGTFMGGELHPARVFGG